MFSSLEKVGMQIDYIDCDCGDAGHVIRFTYDDGCTQKNDHRYEPLLCIEHQLAHDLGFWQRVKVAFRYALGLSNNWSCTMINAEEAQRVVLLIDRYKQAHQRWSLHEKHVCKDCGGQGGVSSCNTCGLCAWCKRVDEHDFDCLSRHSL